MRTLEHERRDPSPQSVGRLEKNLPSPIISEALKCLEKTTSNKTASSEEFRKNFPRESSRISVDQGRVCRKQAEIAKSQNSELKEFSHLAERVIEHCIADLGCLGSAIVRQASDYDELFNGADLVVEWVEPEGGQTTRLALDVTLADRQSSVAQKKTERQEQKIDRRGLSTLAYHQNTDGTLIMDVQVAHAVVHISKETVREFANRYIPLTKSRENLLAMAHRYELHASDDYQGLLKNTKVMIEQNAANIERFFDTTKLKKALPEILFRQIEAHLSRAQKTLQREQADTRTDVEHEYPQLMRVHKKLLELVEQTSYTTTHGQAPSSKAA